MIRPRLSSFGIVVPALLCRLFAADVLDNLPPPIYQQADRCIQSIYSGDFRQAEQEARRIIKDYSDHPAGYFFHAVTLDVWMEYYQSTEKEEELYRYCDLAIRKGEILQDREPGNPWATFFVGGADGYKGTYESRQGRWITAFRFGWKGVSLLMELQKSHPEMSDLNYGIGNYQYWRSAMTQRLVWMPGVEDKRAEGIKKLQDAAENGIFTRVPACAELISIYLNETRYSEALELADRMVGKFPNSLVFYWGRAEALAGLRKFGEAEAMYRRILRRVEAEDYDNHYNAVVCHYWLAKVHLETRNYTGCIAECNRMSHYKLEQSVRKRLKRFFEEAEDVRKQATAARVRTHQPQLLP